MRTWLIYGSVVLVSVIAGVMLGGGPGALLDSSESSAFVSSADDVPPTAPAVDDFTIASAPGAEESTAPVTTQAALAPTDAPAVTVSTEPPVTDPPADTTTTTSEPAPLTTATTIATDEPVVTATPDEAIIPAKTDLSVAVLNGIGTPGLAGRAANALTGLGYTEPDTRDTNPAPRTLVYFRTGLDAAASRLAVDSGLPADATSDFDAVGSISGIDAGEFDLVLILGGDRIGLASA